MRYTTIIDIRDQPLVYKNVNCRLVYMHLALRAGYHDNDRDICNVSLRTLATEVGITLSACRHALAVLARAKLVARQGTLLIVRKWTIEGPITPRAKTVKQQKQQQAAAQAVAIQEQRNRQRQAADEKFKEQYTDGPTAFRIYYEEMRKKAAAGDLEAQAFVKQNEHYITNK